MTKTHSFTEHVRMLILSNWKHEKVLLHLLNYHMLYARSLFDKKLFECKNNKADKVICLMLTKPYLTSHQDQDTFETK